MARGAAHTSAQACSLTIVPEHVAVITVAEGTLQGSSSAQGHGGGGPCSTLLGLLLLLELLAGGCSCPALLLHLLTLQLLHKKKKVIRPDVMGRVSGAAPGA